MLHLEVDVLLIHLSDHGEGVVGFLFLGLAVLPGGRPVLVAVDLLALDFGQFRFVGGGGALLLGSRGVDGVGIGVGVVMGLLGECLVVVVVVLVEGVITIVEVEGWERGGSVSLMF